MDDEADELQCPKKVFHVPKLLMCKELHPNVARDTVAVHQAFCNETAAPRTIERTLCALSVRFHRRGTENFGQFGGEYEQSRYTRCTMIPLYEHVLRCVKIFGRKILGE